jgi:hypothetical protein
MWKLRPASTGVAKEKADTFQSVISHSVEDFREIPWRKWKSLEFV